MKIKVNYSYGKPKEQDLDRWIDQGLEGDGIERDIRNLQKITKFLAKALVIQNPSLLEELAKSLDHYDYGADYSLVPDKPTCPDNETS